MKSSLRFCAILALALFASLPAAAQSMRYTHNGSMMRLTQDGDQVIIVYVKPRNGLAIQEGTVLFNGKIRGGVLSGAARLFSNTCEEIKYLVSGPFETEPQEFTLSGVVPKRNMETCKVEGPTTDSAAATLRFVQAPLGEDEH